MKLFDNAKKWFEISEDELHHREEFHQKLHIDPAQRAKDLIDKSLDNVMTSLGVDTSKDIPTQQFNLGIAIVEIYQEDMFIGYNGFYVIVKGNPYAMVAPPYIGSDGKLRCKTFWIDKEKVDEREGGKVIHLTNGEIFKIR